MIRLNVHQFLASFKYFCLANDCGTIFLTYLIHQALTRKVVSFVTPQRCYDVFDPFSFYSKPNSYCLFKGSVNLIKTTVFNSIKSAFILWGRDSKWLARRTNYKSFKKKFKLINTFSEVTVTTKPYNLNPKKSKVRILV